MKNLTLNYAACSDRGLVRGNNEDSAYAGPHLLALADGMGGHAAGEVASQFLINSLRTLDSPLLDQPDSTGNLTTMLATAMDEGNQAIASHVDENPQLEGMGCTLSTILFRGDQAGLCHVGDSRAYLLRDGELQQITKDDTFVQTLVDEGKLDPEDVSNHPQRSLILKALTGRAVDPTLTTFGVKAGDRFMLCSDGLSDPVSFETIAEALTDSTPEHASRRLVELALRSGGPDNVTVVIGDVVELDPATNQPTDSAITLPEQPVLAGAIAGKTPEPDRPNTAASRAAALDLHTINRPADQSNNNPAATNTNPAAANAATNAANTNAAAANAATDGTPAAGRTQKKRNPKKTQPHNTRGNKKGAITALIAVLIVLAGAAAGAWYVYKDTRNHYYVAEENNHILIYNGKRDGLLRSLNKPYQEICLSNTGKVTTYSTNTTPPQHDGKDCHPFSTTDLTPAARGAITTLPDAPYNQTLNQVHRLALQTLPVCVTRTSDTRNPEDLTTPGVSCREVK